MAAMDVGQDNGTFLHEKISNFPQEKVSTVLRAL